jgi:hypothetical protein
MDRLLCRGCNRCPLALDDLQVRLQVAVSLEGGEFTWAQNHRVLKSVDARSIGQMDQVEACRVLCSSEPRHLPKRGVRINKQLPRERRRRPVIHRGLGAVPGFGPVLLDIEHFKLHRAS